MLTFVLGFCVIFLPFSFSFPYLSNDTMKDLKNLRTTDLKELLDDIKSIETKISDIENDISGRKWKKYGGHCYLFTEHRTDWPGAVRTCQDMGGYLVKVDNATEDAFLASEITSHSWIGLSDVIQKKFRWTVDQQPASYTHFAIGEPNLHQPGCVYIQTNKFWYDSYCTPQYRFICEHNNCG